MMDFEKVKAGAQGYERAMTAFLRDLIAIPGESCGEEGVIRRIAKEMEAVGFDKVQIDPMGNVMGTMGTGKKLIAFDAHIDTVGVGNPANWTFDPYAGFESETEIGGRGILNPARSMGSCHTIIRQPVSVFRYSCSASGSASTGIRPRVQLVGTWTDCA